MGAQDSSNRQEPASAQSDAAASARRGRLPLVVTVGFTGHRAIADAAQAAELMDRALATIRVALELALATELPDDIETLAETYDGQTRLRLLTGDAPGADRIASARWAAAGLGETHKLYPFGDPAAGVALTDRPDRASPETRVVPPPGGAWTVIDGLGLGLVSDQAHAEVSQWIVRHADLLIALWDGEALDKSGGTGDTLRKALDRGLPAIWLEPGEAGLRLIDPAALHRHSGAPEDAAALAKLAQALTAPALAALLAQALAPPDGGREGARAPEVMARRDYAAVDPLRLRRWPLGLVQQLMDRTLWRSFKLFERLAGRAAGGPGGPRPAAPAAVAGQPGFAVVGAALSEAARRAEHLSRIHRSEQLLLVLIATFAVLVGALPAVLPPDRSVHVIAAGFEFGLGVVAFVVALAARRAHRHRRWSDARRLAERLRAARATWPLGIDIADGRLAHAQTWTEWRALAVLRAAGPRRGWLTRAAFDETADWVLADLIGGQIAYHARQQRLAANIERSIRSVEGAAFGLLMGTLGAYVLASLFGPPGLTRPHWVGGLVTVVSAVSPAVGAACLALDATSGFGELALRSRRMEHEFEQLKLQMFACQGAYRHVQDVVRRAAQLLVEDADAWRDRVTRRRIVRGT